jgi:molybdopterin synthase catalytic subunit
MVQLTDEAIDVQRLLRVVQQPQAGAVVLFLGTTRQYTAGECAIVHRLGLVPLAEASVAIAVSSAHRDAAFEAGQWLINTLKNSVPIWKQERWSDGAVEWIHPGPEESPARADR